MTLLLSDSERTARARVASGALAPLADSLSADLEPLLAARIEIPREKARLTRAGGRCPADGSALDYDPWSPHEHRCPRCGRSYHGEAHYRYWLMWHQLWIAERAVHAATLFSLRGDHRHRELALSILSGSAERYPGYPNRDNVLGPSRVFFSTYLESIWLLQLCVAIDLLEIAGVRDDVLARARDRIVAPSAALIATYHEGTSNRQAWNVAAMLAASRVLGQDDRTEELASGSHGLRFLLERALLPDGSWYEGENYHVFAHRGLWYGVTIAERAGCTLEPELIARFDRGFALPFRTALPDMTMLARRDSQHAISLRQWRFAELCELGLSRHDDPALRAALARLYANDIPRVDTGRSRSSAEAERHSPPSALTRWDLGWRSLLHARERLPPVDGAAPRSVLLRGQGLAVLRRDSGRLFAALDYGETGGGHGHPDRLNLVVCDGPNRWLDDPGTGSYVDRSLHWYRSTLAHCAPLTDRASQPRLPGALLAFDERGAAGWVAARAMIGNGVVAERRLVAMQDYVLDDLSWAGAGGQVVALPIHLELDLPLLDWAAGTLGGAGGLEDGFDFVESAEVAVPAEWPLRAVATEPETAATADVWLAAPPGTRVWRAIAPGPPGRSARRFVLLESPLPRGTFVTILAPRRTIVAVTLRDASIIVEHADGTVHEHAGGVRSWRIALGAAGATSSIDLAGAVDHTPHPPAPVADAAMLDSDAADEVLVVRSGDELRFHLGEDAYRRSEESWSEAGEPTADISVSLERGALCIDVAARTGPPTVIPDGADNDMDNEEADVNASGVQLSVRDDAGRVHRWLIRPGPDGATRVRALSRGTLEMQALTAASDADWGVRVEIPLRALGPASPYLIALGVTVNEIPPGRERRRGQLVLGGADGEWVYLRGDRDDPSKLLPLVID